MKMSSLGLSRLSRMDICVYICSFLQYAEKNEICLVICGSFHENTVEKGFKQTLRMKFP